MRNNGARRSPWCLGVSSWISPTFFRPQCRRTFCDAVLPGIGIGTDRFKAEGPEPVIDDGCGRFPAMPVSPIGLAQPVPERRLFAAVAGATVEPHAADQTVGFVQRDCEAARPAGRVILLYASYPLAPIGFTLGVRYRSDPARDFPVAGQRHKIDKVVVAVCSNSQPLGFDDHAARSGRWCPHSPSPAPATNLYTIR
jgi:hypothetical protein